MKKYILWSLAVAVALGASSCKNEEEDLFGSSSADRLEQYKKDYTDLLTKDGGKWVLEYFANENEPGYVFVVTFSNDGSVQMASNNKWTRTGKYDTDNSLWEIISDNGPVLTFNSYNQVFHVFSSPENIIGGPQNDNQQDVDETGKGHEGDYEFMVMGANEDQTVIKLEGKKRFNYAYLRKLDASVNDEEYLAEVAQMAENVFNKFFPQLIMVDGTGEKYVFTDVTPSWLGNAKGMVEAYPQAGDWVTQTSKENAIITRDGFRFRNPLGIERANNDNDSIVVESFSIDADGSLVCKEDPSIRVNVGDFGDVMILEGKIWSIDTESAEGELAGLYESFNNAIMASANKLRIKNFNIETPAKSFVNDELKTYIRIALAGRRNLNLEYLVVPAPQGDRLAFSSIEATSDNSQAFLQSYPDLNTILNDIASGMDLSCESRIAPVRMKATTAKGSFYLDVKK